jgi:hypothetical protein
MAYNIQLLKADIVDELDKISHVVNEFNCVKEKIDLPSLYQVPVIMIEVQ